VRPSLALYNTRSEIDRLADAVARLVRSPRHRYDRSESLLPPVR
jgi:hypothetical protein